MFLPAESDTGAPGAGQEAEGYGERDADCKEEANNDDQDEADAAPIRAPAPQMPCVTPHDVDSHPL